MNFVHLHNHTHYSLLDGLSKPKELVLKAKEQGSSAIAITDHGVLYGLLEFYKEAHHNDIKPILGCEVYLHPISRFNRDKNSKYYHLTLLAYNNEGYDNLIKLTTIAHLEGFYYKPRIDYELLKEHSNGLICLSGCLKSHVAQTIINGNFDKTSEIIKLHQNIFGKENFFLELQDHPNLPDQKVVNDELIKLSSSLKCEMVVTNDSHYINSEDRSAHDVLICIQTQKTVNDENRMKYLDDFSLRNPEELQSAFPNLQRAFENTDEIAQRCNVKLKLHRNLIPSFQVPFNKSVSEYFEEQCREGFIKRYGSDKNITAESRFNYELEMIKKMGFETYFLIIHDLVAFAKKNDIVVGPGRGSAAGSIIAYCLEITDIDPLKYGLLFERFLNPERVSMPDIDIDFADKRRDEIINYVIDKYGKDRVAQIITFGTMASRAAVRDSGRALGYSYSEVDRIAKLIPPPIQGKHQPLERSIKKDADLKGLYETDKKIKKLLDTAIKLEGTVRHAGTHACAVVISKEPLVNYCALQKAPGEESGIITQYSMKPLEEIGLLKMDFLGLKNLTIIETTLNLLKKLKNITLELNNILMDDHKTFELLQKGETIGVFQMESAGMRRYLKDLEPTCFEDIIAMISLYRPGPMEWIPDYIRRKHGTTKITYLHESLMPILKSTYGIGIYQEQILEIARNFSGYTLGEADILRRAIGKKNPKELVNQRKKFIDGALSLGNKEKLAEDIFDKVIEPFAGYGFNKSHAACYALISYQTAYLKANFPSEFMSALLSSDFQNADRIAIEITECERMGIKVLAPSINESSTDFTCISNNQIRFGLNAIKGLGTNSTDEILKERQLRGKFKSLQDFVQRMPPKIINKKSLESLAYSGAFDEVIERNTVICNMEQILAFSKGCEHEIKEEHQIDIFSMMSSDDEHIYLNLKSAKPCSVMEKLTQEKKYLGLYVSGHPLDGLKKYFQKKVHLIKSLSKKELNKSVIIGGLIYNLKKITTKNGQPMMYGSCQDPTCQISFTVFPKTFQQFRDVFEEDKIVIMSGILEKRGYDYQLICAEAKSISLEKVLENAKQEGLFDINDKVDQYTQNNNQTEDIGNGSTEEVEDQASLERIDYPYIIDIPAGLSEEKLTQLKSALLKCQGDKAVELHIRDRDNIKKIRLPLLVSPCDNLTESIKKILEPRT